MPEQPPTLRDMVKTALARGNSLRDLEKRADDGHGNVMRKDTIGKIANGLQDRSPTESALRGLAAALGVPYERVRQAAVRQWYPPETTDADDIPEETKVELRARVQELLAVAGQLEADLEGSADDDARRGGAA